MRSPLLVQRLRRQQKQEGRGITGLRSIRAGVIRPVEDREGRRSLVSHSHCRGDVMGTRFHPFDAAIRPNPDHPPSYARPDLVILK